MSIVAQMKETKDETHYKIHENELENVTHIQHIHLVNENTFTQHTCLIHMGDSHFC